MECLPRILGDLAFAAAAAAAYAVCGAQSHGLGPRMLRGRRAVWQPFQRCCCLLLLLLLLRCWLHLRRGAAGGPTEPSSPERAATRSAHQQRMQLGALLRCTYTSQPPQRNHLVLTCSVKDINPDATTAVAHSSCGTSCPYTALAAENAASSAVTPQGGSKSSSSRAETQLQTTLRSVCSSTCLQQQQHQQQQKQKQHSARVWHRAHTSTSFLQFNS